VPPAAPAGCSGSSRYSTNQTAILTPLTSVSRPHHQDTGLDQAREPDRACHSKLIRRSAVIELTSDCINTVIDGGRSRQKYVWGSGPTREAIAIAGSAKCGAASIWPDASAGGAVQVASSTPRRRERRDHRVVEGCDLPCSAILNEYAQAQFPMRGQGLPLGRNQPAQLIDDIGKRDVGLDHPDRDVLRAVGRVLRPRRKDCVQPFFYFVPAAHHVAANGHEPRVL